MRSKNGSISKPLLAVIGVFAAIALSAAPGDLDLTFSGDGRVTDWVGVGRAVAIQPDGRIVERDVVIAPLVDEGVHPPGTEAEPEHAGASSPPAFR